MDARELYWAAGFFEGEGTIRINKNPKRKARTMGFQIINTDLESLQRFRRGVFGLGDIGGPYGPYNGVTKQKTYCWRSNRFSDVVALKGLLFPLLSERRKQQIIDAHNSIKT